MSKNIVLCTETLGSANNSVILSIGAMSFGGNTTSKNFYTVLNGASCLAAGLTVDFRALCWWMDQPDETRMLFEQADHGTMLVDALQGLTDAFDWDDTLVWSGETYYNVLSTLEHAYRAAGMQQPWSAYNARCYQTWQETALPQNMRLPYLNGSPTALLRAQNQAYTMLAVAETTRQAA